MELAVVSSHDPLLGVGIEGDGCRCVGGDAGAKRVASVDADDIVGSPDGEGVVVGSIGEGGDGSGRFTECGDGSARFGIPDARGFVVATAGEEFSVRGDGE